MGGVARSFSELARLASDDLRELLSRGEPDLMRDPVDYEEQLHARTVLEERGEIDSPAVQAERERNDRQDALKAQRKAEREESIRSDGVILPAWWFASGAFVYLSPAEVKVAVSLTMLVDPARNNDALSYATIADAAGKGVGTSTAKRAVKVLKEAGLIGKYTKRVPGSNPPRSTCFYTIRRTGGHP